MVVQINYQHVLNINKHHNVIKIVVVQNVFGIHLHHYVVMQYVQMHLLHYPHIMIVKIILLLVQLKMVVDVFH